MTTRRFCNICGKPAPSCSVGSARKVKYEHQPDGGCGPVRSHWEATIVVSMTWPDRDKFDAHLCDACFWKIVTGGAPKPAEPPEPSEEDR